MSGRQRFAALCTLLLLAVSPAVLATDGTVVDSVGRPVVGAQACYVAGNADLYCSVTDDRGNFSLPDSEQDSLRVLAEGYMPKTVVASTLVAPIVLLRSPTLIVRLVDGEGERLNEGEVSVVYSTGQSRGPFPVNASGVRIRRVLPPGEARVVARAEGFRQEKPEPVELEAGKTSEVEIRLVPAQSGEGD